MVTLPPREGKRGGGKGSEEMGGEGGGEEVGPSVP